MGKPKARRQILPNGIRWRLLDLLESLSFANDEDEHAAPLATTSFRSDHCEAGLKGCHLTIPRTSCNRRIDFPF